MPKISPLETVPTGLALLPLRLFIGVTFAYAGLQKFSSASYWSTTAPDGFLKQTRASSVGSPISFLLNHAAEHHSLAAFGIAAGELLAGLGLLLGVWTRLSAIGAFAISTSLYLSVSWQTHPYFTGSDIVFMAALVPFLIVGDSGYLSVEQVIRERVLSAHGVKPGQKLSNRPVEELIRRRTLVQTGVVAGSVGVVGLLVGFVSKGRATSKAVSAANSSASPSTSASTSPSTSGAAPAGVKVAAVSDVKVGGAFQFTAADGNPAYIVQPKAGTYLAYSAVCTHEGCTVGYKNNEFACPCHGARFDPTSGTPTAGPARKDLQKYTVTVSGTDIYVA